MSQENQIRPSEGLRHVKYEIRGRLARRAQELERQGYEIVPLNIGNPAAFGFRTPETMRLAMIENMPAAEFVVDAPEGVETLLLALHRRLPRARP